MFEKRRVTPNFFSDFNSTRSTSFLGPFPQAREKALGAGLALDKICFFRIFSEPRKHSFELVGTVITRWEIF